MPDSLSPEYTVETLPLKDDAVATLVSLPAAPSVPPRGAMLYLHGFVDYFFQDHVARYFTAHGWAWYALDLRRNGRSMRNGDERWYTKDLTEYYEEIDLAIERVQADGHADIVMMGHSTGGLTASIWAHDRRKNLPISALVLNSPWLDLQEPWFTRTIGTWVIRAVAKVAPQATAPQGLAGPYAESLHRDALGEWAFDTRWKPLQPVPVKLGFLASVRAQQARLHCGLDVPVPVLMLRSARSRLGLKAWHTDAHSADTVLDVEQMQHWRPAIGRDVTDVPLEGALHDVMLSREPVRSRALESIRTWLDERLPPR